MSKEITTIIEQVSEFEGRFVLGIDGLSRSGKTTLVRNLELQLMKEEIPCYIFHIDDHIEERKKRYGTGKEEWYEYYALQWDTKWLEENFFKKLKDSQQLDLPFYDNESDSRSNQIVTLPENGVIIVEGVFLQRKEWRSYFDYVVYLDCPRERRFFRESEPTQKSIEKFLKRYWKAEDFYLESEEPIKRANLVLRQE
ncbi:kinase [Pseudalkalibacillus caeni]|uniref:Phosphoribulokinase/uridine kinase domain-containing protein n=1 Tax=Exobacillus caeni TaxID=2574798 RepID=A0A5R9F941_9BACL|nr:kinase [Pseudalkalibacillus caeni]TLS37064.1 hypothetical protein FCL54_11070 [Pseudalkalibacillus caeni]